MQKNRIQPRDRLAVLLSVLLILGGGFVAVYLGGLTIDYFVPGYMSRHGNPPGVLGAVVAIVIILFVLIFGMLAGTLIWLLFMRRFFTREELRTYISPYIPVLTPIILFMFDKVFRRATPPTF